MPHLDRKTRLIAKTMRAVFLLFGATFTLPSAIFLCVFGLPLGSIPTPQLISNILAVLEALFIFGLGMFLTKNLYRWYQCLTVAAWVALGVSLTQLIVQAYMMLIGVYTLSMAITHAVGCLMYPSILFACTYILNPNKKQDSDDLPFRCPKCDYPAKGLVVIRCPECGEEYSPG